MHIAHVQGIFSIEHGGPTHSTASYAQAQAAGGHQVSAWVLEGLANTSPAVRVPGVEMRVFPIEFPHRLGRSSAMWQTMRDAPPADVYHMHGAWLRAMYYGAQKARLSDRPYLVEPQGTFEPYAIAQKPWRKRIVRWIYQDRMMRQATCLHVNSQKEADDLRARGFNRPTVILPAGVDVGAIDQASAAVRNDSSPWPFLAGRPFFLFLSRVHKNKGIEPLLSAWGKLAARYSDWVLAVAGPPASPDYAKHVEDLAAQAGVSDRVIFLGKVSSQEKSWLYTHCKFYVLPSFSENFGNTVAEGLAHAKATIATPNTPWGELPAEGCGWIAEPTPVGLAEQVESALEAGDDRRRVMGEKGRALVERKYSLQFVVDSLDATYRWLRGVGPKPGFVSG